MFPQVAEAQATSEGEDYSKDRYGNMPIIKSTEKPDRKLLNVKDISADLHEKKIWVRGRLHTSRSKGGWPAFEIYIGSKIFCEQCLIRGASSPFRKGDMHWIEIRDSLY